MKRIRITRKRPNPLFEMWLSEWQEDAAKAGSEMQYHFAKALASLRKYPLPLRSGNDCIILRHFGAKLCAMLEKKLAERDERREEAPPTNRSRTVTTPKRSKTADTKDVNSPNKEDPVQQKHVRKLQDFQEERPDIRTIRKSWDLYCYAVLFILYRKMSSLKNSGGVTQFEVLLEMQHTFDYLMKAERSKESFERNIKSSIDTLIEEGFVLAPVNRNGLTLTKHAASHAEEMLADRTVAERFAKLRRGSADLGGPISALEMKSFLTSLKGVETAVGVNVLPSAVDRPAEKEEIRLHPNTFDIILLIDTQEVPGKRSKPPEDIDEVRRYDVPYEIRNLKVGDFAWLARCRKSRKELVLPYVVERKRIDDLSASIVDGRFREQKFRLKRCGIENVIYVVESFGKNVRTTISPSALLQASTNSIVQDGFVVKYTKNHRGTMAYLATVSRYLRSVYEGKTLTTAKKDSTTARNLDNQCVSLLEFENFNKSSSKIKTHTVVEMFVRQLLQLKGISVKKATAIVKEYPTPRALMKALRDDGKNAAKLIAGIQCEEKGRQIGAANSKVICEFYTRRELL